MTKMTKRFLALLLAVAATALAEGDADWDGVQTWWFIVEDTVVAIQEAR